MAAVRYKASLKELEDLLSADHPSIDEARIERIEEAFRDLERSAPVVPADIDEDIENRHESFEFVQEAEKLGVRTS